jgi:hypothetical protein
MKAFGFTVLALVASTYVLAQGQGRVLQGSVQQNQGTPTDVFASGGCNWNTGACGMLKAYVNTGGSRPDCLGPLNQGVSLERQEQALGKGGQQSATLDKRMGALEQQRDRILAQLPRDCFSSGSTPNWPTPNPNLPNPVPGRPPRTDRGQPTPVYQVPPRPPLPYAGTPTPQGCLNGVSGATGGWFCQPAQAQQASQTPNNPNYIPNYIDKGSYKVLHGAQNSGDWYNATATVEPSNQNPGKYRITRDGKQQIVQYLGWKQRENAITQLYREPNTGQTLEFHRLPNETSKVVSVVYDVWRWKAGPNGTDLLETWNLF